jgi:hypothetical protein
LTEQQKSLKIDNPFAEEYRNDMSLLRNKQAVVSQLKMDLEKMESHINTTRTQLEMMKHELEVTKSDEKEIIKENSRLETLLDLKRNSSNGGSTNTNGNHALNKNFNKSDSVSNISTTNGSNMPSFKTSQSSNNLRSNTPMSKLENFFFFQQLNVRIDFFRS